MHPLLFNKTLIGQYYLMTGAKIPVDVLLDYMSEILKLRDAETGKNERYRYNCEIAAIKAMLRHETE